MLDCGACGRGCGTATPTDEHPNPGGNAALVGPGIVIDHRLQSDKPDTGWTDSARDPDVHPVIQGVGAPGLGLGAGEFFPTLRVHCPHCYATLIVDEAVARRVGREQRVVVEPE